MKTSPEYSSPEESLAMLEAELVLRKRDLKELTTKIFQISYSYSIEIDPDKKRALEEEHKAFKEKGDELYLVIQELEKKIKLKGDIIID